MSLTSLDGVETTARLANERMRLSFSLQMSLWTMLAVAAKHTATGGTSVAHVAESANFLILATSTCHRGPYLVSCSSDTLAYLVP